MIVTAPADILTTPTVECDPISEEAFAVAADLMQALNADPGAAGIAANQIGSNLRMMVYRDDHNGPTILSNPYIVERRGKRIGWEGCLSLPDLYLVERPHSVVVEAQDIVGDTVRVRGHEFQARLLAHELDHLDGRLIDAFAKQVRVRT